MQPYAIATRSGDVVLKETLDDYSMKESTAYNAEDPFKTPVTKEENTERGESKQAPEGTNKYGAYGLKQPPINPKLLSNLEELNTYHKRSIKTKATDIGGLGWRVEIIGDITPQAKTHKEELIQFIYNCKPNFEEIITNSADDLESIGYLAMELTRIGGLATAKPHRLEHITSHTIRIHKDKNKFMQTWDGVEKRWFKKPGYDKDVDIKTGEEFEIGTLKSEKRANELLYAMNYTAKTSYYGLPEYTPSIKTMIGDESAVNYNIVFFKNYGIPAYAVYITGNFKDEPAKDSEGNKIPGKTVLQVAMEEKLQKVLENPHGGMVFLLPTRGNDSEVKIIFEKLSVETKESSFRLYRQDNRDEIITAHGMDPHQIGVNRSGPLGGDTARQSDKNYKNRIILPRQRKIMTLINNEVIWADYGFGYTDVHIILETIDTEDQKLELDIDTGLFNIAAARPIDIIKKWAAKRGFEIPENVEKNPYLTSYYLNGQPLDPELKQSQYGNYLEDPTIGQVTKILEEFKSNLEEAKKNYEAS